MNFEFFVCLKAKSNCFCGVLKNYKKGKIIYRKSEKFFAKKNNWNL